MRRKKVQYRAIPGFPGYRVGDDGSVWTCRARISLGFGRGTRAVIGTEWKRLKPCVEKKTGYPCVKLASNGKKRNLRVHVLVLRAFRGDRPKGMQSCHRDDNPANNRLRNLRYDTPAGNSEDAIRNGRTTAGERSGTATLTSKDVDTIRQRQTAGEPVPKIAADFGISESHAYGIIRRRFWK